MPDSVVKDAIRRRESLEQRRAHVPWRGVGGLVRPLTEVRIQSQPKPKRKPMEQKVLDVATDYFLEHGYEGASINAMARSSGISKESIYCYFRSKKQLFDAVLGRELAKFRNSLDTLDATLRMLDLRDALLRVAETALAVITADRTLALRRLVFDEATRSSGVGRRYYEVGPEQAYGVVENVLDTHAHVSDFDVPALSRHFVALLSWSITLERECALRQQPTAAEIAESARQVVDDFMKAFLRER